MLLKPVLTEKAYALTGLNKFVFRVDPRATKDQIKHLVETLYKVNVTAITTSRLKTSKNRSLRTGKYSRERGYKKAVVALKSGQKINLFQS